jgi:hypothetical protein
MDVEQTNKQSLLAQHLSDWTEQAAKMYRSRHSFNYVNMDFHIPLLDINPESILQSEIRSVIDELEIMIHLTKQQREVFKRFRKNVERILESEAGRWVTDRTATVDGTAQQPGNKALTLPDLIRLFSSPPGSESSKPSKLSWFDLSASELAGAFQDRIDELEALKTSAISTAQSVADLLALKQQQAAVVQAYQGVKQAQETVFQGRAIIIFTIVTIVFLPLSFMSSIFAIPDAYFGSNGWTLADQFKLMFGVSAVFAVAVLVVAFSTFVRTLIWAAVRYSSIFLSVFTGCYRIWLDMRGNWSSERITHRVIRGVNHLEDGEIEKRKKRQASRRLQERLDAADKLEADTEGRVDESSNAKGSPRPRWLTMQFALSTMSRASNSASNPANGRQQPQQSTPSPVAPPAMTTGSAANKNAATIQLRSPSSSTASGSAGSSGARAPTLSGAGQSVGPSEMKTASSWAATTAQEMIALQAMPTAASRASMQPLRPTDAGQMV